MNILKFIKTPLFFLLVHGVIFVYCTAMIGYMISLRSVTHEMDIIRNQISDTQDLKDVLNTQGNYLQSQTYKIKYLKEILGRKIQGEKVIDTSAWESQNPSDTNYLPAEYTPTETVRWWDCLSGKQLQCFE